MFIRFLKQTDIILILPNLRKATMRPVTPFQESPLLRYVVSLIFGPVLKMFLSGILAWQAVYSSTLPTTVPWFMLPGSYLVAKLLPVWQAGNFTITEA